MMRIVIDMQGAQTESRFRGIGRYTMAFAQAVVRHRGDHEIILALSGLFPDTIQPIRAAFDGLLPQENIRVWHAPGPVRDENPHNQGRREIAELVREAFLASLHPDVIHICSLFEGYVDDAVTSIGRFDNQTPISVTLYDLIPLLNPDQYLAPNPNYAAYYQRKIEALRQAEIYLSISEAARQESLDHLGLAPDKVVNISTAVGGEFQPTELNKTATDALLGKFQLTHPFALYTGGADERKNLPRLIEAWSLLPTTLRDTYQLLLAGKMPDIVVAQLRYLARQHGLNDHDLLFSGYVSDEELVQLYNLCTLYVFPSWHEGFGLPALEAMACGAPVIGAYTSSLPEVIGLDDALFDPFDTQAITAKLAHALQDDAFRQRLREHSLQQAKKFSWDETAKRAISAWESLPPAPVVTYQERTYAQARLYQKLAVHAATATEVDLVNLSASLAQNQQAGVERQLFLDVSELCQHDAATGVQRVVRSYLKWLLQSPPVGFRVEPVYATREEGYRYARAFTLRFLGLSPAPDMDTPMRWQRGDLFFGLDMQHHVQLTHAPFYRQLMNAGVAVKFLVYDLLPIQLADLFKDSNAKELHGQWLAMIAATDGAICISKATMDAFDAWITERAIPRASTFQLDWVHIGEDFESVGRTSDLPEDAATVLHTLGQRPTFLCVSTIEPRKCQQQILEAIEQLWQAGTDVNLVLVGQQGWKTEHLTERLRIHPEADRRLFWLQGISDEYLEKVYAASTCLIAASLNEGFGLSLIEAARHRLPIIARDIPVFREVAGQHAEYFEGETAQDLATALKTWLNKYKDGQHLPSHGMRWSTWQESAEKLKTALTQRNPRRQLLVDISELVQRDARTGIQRVVRSVLKEWLQHPPEGYRVEPVYATVGHGYRYARQFTKKFLGISENIVADEPIDYAPGDIFFGLDLQPQVQVAQRAFFQQIRRQGVSVQFLVHDLLPILMPHCFYYGGAEGFIQWLEVVVESDGAVCVSKATAVDLVAWIKDTGSAQQRPIKITWSHNGSDTDNLAPPYELPKEAEAVLAALRNRHSFLVVGTLEPRKGHAQVLDAFDQLWQSGSDLNLAIAGKQGWMVENLVARLHAHSQKNERLFWFEDISDEFLEEVYAASTCLIAASYGEGFGLPLIEAAQHKLPIIARDIPVFREVAGEHAFYFNAASPNELAQSVTAWLDLYRQGKHPSSDAMPWMTWSESAKNLAEHVLDSARNHAKEHQ